MAEEEFPDRIDPEADIDKIIDGILGEYSDAVLDEKNLRQNQTTTINMLKSRELDVSYFEDGLRDIPQDKDLCMYMMGAISNDIHGLSAQPTETDDDLLSKYDKLSGLYERFAQAVWIEKVSLMLSASGNQGTPIPMQLYDSKKMAQASVLIEDSLSDEWKVALIAIIDEIATGESITSATEEEKILLEIEVLSEEDYYSISKQYHQVARDVISTFLGDFRFNDDFERAVTLMGMVVLDRHRHRHVDDFEHSEALSGLVNRHLASMGLTLGDEIVQEALSHAQDALRKM